MRQIHLTNQEIRRHQDPDAENTLQHLWIELFEYHESDGDTEQGCRSQSPHQHPVGEPAALPGLDTAREKTEERRHHDGILRAQTDGHEGNGQKSEPEPHVHLHQRGDEDRSGQCGGLRDGHGVILTVRLAVRFMVGLLDGPAADRFGGGPPARFERQPSGKRFYFL